MILIIVGAVLLAAGIGMYFASVSNAKKAFKMKATQTSKVSDLVETAKSISGDIGGGAFRQIAEVKGISQASNPLTSELAGAACVWYSFTISREYEETYYETDSEGHRVQRTRRSSEIVSQNTQSIPFYVKDDTGQIRIDLAGAKITPVKSHSSFRADGGGNFASFLSAFTPMSGTRTLGYRYEEEVLPLNRDLYVLGEASDNGGELSIRQPEDKKEIFLVSTKSEEQMIKEAQGAQTGFLVGSVIAAIAGIVSVVVGILNPNIGQ